MEFTDIIFDEIPGQFGNLGVITLNRPRVLNAINHSMFIHLEKQLKHWASSKFIKAVFIKAVPGRAFSSGGDIRAVYEKKRANDGDFTQFFIDEYHVNRYIYHFPKPYIAFLNGITMGGGAGVSIHGSHRIGTENLSFAMPETGIGFFPDIGSSYFLTRIPYRFGFYIGLTGERILYNDCLALGVVDYIISASAEEPLIDALVHAPLPDKAAVDKIIRSFSLPVPVSTLFLKRDEVASAFSKLTVEEILKVLEDNSDKWALNIAKNIKNKSPTSLKVTLQLLLKAETLSFDECMDMEHDVMRHFLHAHDFYEGIRAALIDKDHQPHWQPAKLSEVNASLVNQYFEEDLTA